MNGIYALSGITPFDDTEEYLGAPLCSSRIRIGQCLQLYEKITAKIPSWPTSKLSMVGRRVIVKAIATSMCLYYARILILPYKLLNMINSALTHFLWHGNPYSRKLVPIAFKALCCLYQHGGLGIMNIKIWNHAALSSRVDKIFRYDSNLWDAWTRTHLIKSNTFWKMSIPSYCSWSWRNILHNKSACIPIFQSRMRIRKEIFFGYDPWVKQGVILADLININLRHTSGIAEKASVDHFWSDGEINLPYSSSYLVRNVWNIIQTNTYNATDNHTLWNGKEHVVKTVYKLLLHNTPLNIFSWHTRVWTSSSPQKRIYSCGRCLEMEYILLSSSRIGD